MKRTRVRSEAEPGEQESSGAAPPRRASTGWRSRPRSWSARVNAYLIEDSPLTLIDSGPNSAKALDELEQALAAHGHAIEDIELLVISHQHMDHFGLASILARRSGAEVAALDKLAPFLAAYGHETELEDRFAEQLMLRHGIPPMSSPRCARCPRASARGARRWRSPARCRTGASCSCATARCGCSTGPGTAPRTPYSWTRIARSCSPPIT